MNPAHQWSTMHFNMKTKMRIFKKEEILIVKLQYKNLNNNKYKHTQSYMIN